MSRRKTFAAVAVLIVVITASVFVYYKANKQTGYETERTVRTITSNYDYELTMVTIRPKASLYTEETFPAVLQIGGGWGLSTFLLDSINVRKAASEGLIIAAFDSYPKEQYDIGSENRDYNGFKDQDDVDLVLATLFNESNVNPNLVSVWSNSNGITLASGVLGRDKYKNLSQNIIFLLDNEGPHNPKAILNNPNITLHGEGTRDRWNAAINAKVGVGKQYSTEDDFWAERCAINFIGNFTGVYQRVQAIDDHKLTDYHGHAIAMINVATSPNGMANWTRLNLQPRDQTYTCDGGSGGIDIDTVIDIEKLAGPNDPRIWDIFFDLLSQFT